jgi:DNA-binding GntR family transcriptional regulator
MPELHTIHQPPALAQIAYRALRDSILARRLEPGEVYTESALAKDFGISKTPVREALKELAGQGLVTFLPRRGVLVNRYCERDVEEVFEVRAAIELAVVEKVAGAIPPADLGSVEGALRLQREAAADNRKLAFLEADRLFHTAFGELAGNGRLLAILENVRDLIQVMGMEALAHENRPKEVLEEHVEVVGAIRAGDPALARTAMARHLDRSKESVLVRYRSEVRHAG